jgi:hypothetical protein
MIARMVLDYMSRRVVRPVRKAADPLVRKTAHSVRCSSCGKVAMIHRQPDGGWDLEPIEGWELHPEPLCPSCLRGDF